MQLLVLATELAPQLSTELLAHLLVDRPDDTPKPEDVKAGWTAFAIFLLLALAVVGLGVALTKQLRRTEANRKAGAFGPVADDAGPGSEDRPGTDGRP